MAYRDSQRYRKVYSYFRPNPRATDQFDLASLEALKQFFLDMFNGYDWKQSVRVASVSDVPLASTLTTLDGITLIDEDRVLLKDQSLPAENGIYIYSSTTQLLSRTLDAIDDFLTCGAACYIEDGTEKGNVFFLATNDPIDVDTTAQTWTRFSPGGGGSGQYFISTTPGSIYTSGSTAFVGNGNEYSVIDSPLDKGSDVFFYVSGSITNVGTSDKKSLFGGDLVVSGSVSQGLCVASGYLSHAEGDGTTASATAAHAEGYQTSASQIRAHAEGYRTTASGGSSHSEGANTLANGNYAHAEGYLATGSGNFSHAEGHDTRSRGFASHAEGYLTIASGSYSHAEGSGSISLGRFSHAEGYSTIASGTYSHTNGIFTIASGSGQTIVGHYNNRNNNTSLFTIGDGSGDSDANRHDLLNAKQGLLEVTGSLVVTGSVSVSGSMYMSGSIIPDADTTYTLGTSSNRWAHVYTGDLHLRNERGDWTIVEERDFLCVVNNITGKKYKMMLQPLENE